MTTAGTTTRTKPKFCAQTFAGLASLGILVHFVHELIVEGGALPAVLTGGTASDVTGLLTILGGGTLVFAAYWDHVRPLERAL